MIPYIQFPTYFKFVGLFFYISGFVLASYYNPNIQDTTSGISLLVQLFILIGLLLICCAKQKNEDEFIQYCRLKSLQWAVLIFVLLRVFFKTMVWIKQDMDWTPKIQVNALLQIYLILFYYQIYFKDLLMKLFKTNQS